jgi:anti-sigma-K factor RskA
MDRQTLLKLLHAYALNHRNLDADERTALEALLATDTAARDELAAYRAIMDALVFTAPIQTPPPHLADDLRARLHPGPRRWRQARRVMLLAAALVIVLLGVIAVLLRGEPGADVFYHELLASESVTRIAVVPVLTPDIEGELVYEAGSDRAVIRVSQLPPLAEGQAFQVWLVDEAGARSGGIYQFTAATNYIRLPLDRPVEAYTRFGMSIEPAAGSPLINGPSGPQVFGVSITSS